MISLDTNILFYAYDAVVPAKHELSARILEAAAAQKAAFFTLQVLGEFAFAAVRKGLLDRTEASAALRDWVCIFDVAEATAADVDVALDLWSTERCSYWDAVLIATSARAGATALVTEDLADGTVVLGVEILNPFKPGYGERLARHGLQM